MIATALFKSPSHSYKLEIESDGILAAETLTLAGSQPVKIGFQQTDLKFSGFRTVTARVRIISDKDMSYLYASSATGTACRIYQDNAGTWVPVFLGYLKPFVFRAPFTGVGDTIELEAVDAISALKYTNYTLSGQQFPDTASNWLIYVASCAGIHRICAHANFGKKDFSQVAHNLEKLKISSQAWLPQDFLNEKGDVPLTDIVTDICQFFGYTAVLWGDTLYLYDTAAMPLMGTHHHFCTLYEEDALTGDVTRTDQTVGTTLLKNDMTISEGSIMASDCLMSVEQGFAKAVLKQRDPTGQIVLPDLLKSDSRTETYHRDNVQNGSDGNNTGHDIFFNREILTDSAIDFHVYNWQTGAEITVQDFINTPGLLSPTRDVQVDWSGALPIYLTNFSVGNDYKGQTVNKYIWIRKTGNFGDFGTKTLFSIKTKAKGYFTGKRIRVSAVILNRTDSTGANYLPPVYGSLGTSGATGCVNLYVKSGSKYYQAKASTTTEPWPNQTKWITTAEKAPMMFGSDSAQGAKSIQSSGYAFTKFETGWIDTSEEGVLDLYWRCSLDEETETRNYWISDIKIECDGADPDDSASTITFDSNGSEELSVDYGLIYGYYPQKRIVLGSSFDSVWAHESNNSTSSIPLAGVLSKQITGRYGQSRPSYQITLGENIMPWSLCTLQSNKYTVDALDWDLMEETKTVVLD